MAARSAKTTFGAEVRKLRLLAGMSLRYLARRVGISPVYLSDIENNRKPAPSADILQAIMSTLHADHDEFMRMAMKSVEDYGCVARKPRMSEQLSADEYLLIIRKKQTLEPEEFKLWLNAAAITGTRNERKIRQHLRGIVAARFLRNQQTTLDFDAAAGSAQGRPRTRSNAAAGEKFLRMNGRSIVLINHYEGQSEKDAMEIFIDTCYREWRSIRSEFGRSCYCASLEHHVYMMRMIALSPPALTEGD